jgi:threonine dehydratase
LTGVSLDEIQAARAAIAPYVHRTPLFYSETLSAMTGTTLWLKAENLQKTGCFKPRGVVNAVLSLEPHERARGVMTFSAGNTAQALAYAARVTGTPATVVMPETAPAAKAAAVRDYGAELVQVPMADLLRTAEEVREARGRIMVHPWENRALIAGHGTLGLEILDDLPEVALVVVPVGGGGLISGIVCAVKAVRPHARVIGVEPEASTAVSQSLAAGRPVQIVPASIADGLNAPSTAATPLAIVRELVDEIVTVSDAAIAGAMRLIVERTKLLVEPSGAAAVAALLSGAVRAAPDESTAAILSGGNVDLTRLGELVGSSG